MVRKRRERHQLSRDRVHGCRYPPFTPAPLLPESRKAEERSRLSGMSVDAFIGTWTGVESWEGTGTRARHTTAPTLVIHGARDLPLVVEESRRFAQIILGAALEVVPGSRHQPHWEGPNVFSALLRRFFTALHR